MMNKDKPITENAWQKADRLAKEYTGILRTEAIPKQVIYHWNDERRHIMDVLNELINEAWGGIQYKQSMFIRVQGYLKKHYDNILVPQGKCLDVYGRITNITKDWKPESNNIP